MGEFNNSEINMTDVGNESVETNELIDKNFENDIDNKYNDYLEDGKAIDFKKKNTDSPKETENLFYDNNEMSENTLEKELDDRYNEYINDNRTYEKADANEAHFANDLPETFDNLSDADKEKQMNALSKMSDAERSKYIEIASREPEITTDAKEITTNNGGELQGLDDRLKTPDSTYEKMYDRESKTDISEMKDVIRYTEVYPPDNLSKGTNDSLAEYASRGYSVDRVKNTWNDENPTYKGINANLTSPDGQTFEVQFHTQESFDLKTDELHSLYKERRTVSDDNPKAIELEDKMKDLSAGLESPKNVDEVKNR